MNEFRRYQLIFVSFLVSFLFGWVLICRSEQLWSTKWSKLLSTCPTLLHEQYVYLKHDYMELFLPSYISHSFV